MQRNSPSLSLFFAYLKFIHYSFVIPAHVHWVLSQNHWSQHLAADLLQGHHFPSFIQRSVGMSQSPPSPPAVPLRPNHYPPGIQEHVAAPHALLSHRALWLVQTVGNLNQSKTHTLIWKCGTISRSQEASRDQILSTETSATQRSNHGTYNCCTNDHFNRSFDSDPQGKLNTAWI